MVFLVVNLFVSRVSSPIRSVSTSIHQQHGHSDPALCLKLRAFNIPLLKKFLKLRIASSNTPVSHLGTVILAEKGPAADGPRYSNSPRVMVLKEKASVRVPLTTGDVYPVNLIRNFQAPPLAARAQIQGQKRKVPTHRPSVKPT